MEEGKFQRVGGHLISWYCPIYMLTKKRSYAKPELGYKDRTIFNNSAKVGGLSGINEGVRDEDRKMKFPDPITAIKMQVNRIKQNNPSQKVFMGKGDIQNGFENLWIPVRERKFLGVNIHGMTMVSIVGEYGEASKPLQMHTLLVCAMYIIQEIVRKKYNIKIDIVGRTIKYMDDFSAWDGTKMEVDRGMYWIIFILDKHLGVKCKAAKTIWGSPEIEFLGILNNGLGIKFKVGITQDRKAKLIYRGKFIIARKQVALVNYDKFHGCGMSAAVVHWPLKSLLRNISMFIKYQVHVLKKERTDMVMANRNINETIKFVMCAMGYIKNKELDDILDYKRLFLDKQTRYDFVIHTDASTEGAGVFILNNGHWGFYKWPQKITHKEIQWGEAIIILMTILTFKEMFKGKKLRIWVDNEPVKDGFVNKKHGNIKVDKIIYQTYLECIKHDIFIRFDWIPTDDNIFADKLSRLDIKGFKNRARYHGFEIKKPTKLNTCNINFNNLKYF